MAIPKRLYKDIEKNFIIRGKFYEKSTLQRLRVFIALIYGAVIKQNACLQSIGEQTAKYLKIDAESGVKKAKRFLQSKWTDYEVFYQPYIVELLGILAKKKELVGAAFRFVIDGSVIGKNCVALMLSVVYEKRAIPVCWLCREGKKGHFPQEMHVDLLKTLLGFVPQNTRIVFLGDGEFDGEQVLDLVHSQGWEFVVRTCLNRKIVVERGSTNEQIIHLEEMGYWAETSPDKEDNLSMKIGFVEKALGQYHAILWHEQGYEKPIPLLTNIDLAFMACQYYRKRFSIETLFKDYKSQGFQLQKTKLKDPKMIHNLLIIKSLAYIIVFAIGLIAQKSEYKAKFCRKYRITDLSYFTAGKKLLDYSIDENVSIFTKKSNLWTIFICVR
jgi:hypothetical protein